MPYVRTRLGRLFYEERGHARRSSDAAIILMHSLLCDGGMWRGQIEPLSALGRVINIDGPGHGKSEPPPRFMLEEHADAIFDAMGDLGVGRALVVGLSWGGMVGMRLALQHPEKVAGLVLLDTSAECEPLIDRLRYRAFAALHRRVGMPYGLFLGEVAPKLFSPTTVERRPSVLEATYKRVMGFDRGGVARAAVAVVYHRTEILQRLGQISAPTLVMVGAEDSATPPERAENIARAIPGARVVKLEGLGHLCAVEDPDAVNTHLVPFARSVVLEGEARAASPVEDAGRS